MNRPSRAALAALASSVSLGVAGASALLAGCGPSVGSYCDYTDCNAVADADADAGEAGALLDAAAADGD